MVLAHLPAIQATGDLGRLEDVFMGVVASDEFLTILWPDEEVRKVILAAEAALDEGKLNPFLPSQGMTCIN